ncbi:MAG: hypothetical protein ACOVP2_02785 [Armatimonadaceae bacterium]
MIATCEAKLTFDNASLFREFPNLPRNENKKRVLSIAIPRDYTHTGELTVSAWRPADTLKPITISHEKIVETHVGIYPYEDTAASRIGCEWCVNFADKWLFNYGEGNLLAQDELQIAEHPVASCLRHAMAGTAIEPLTRDPNNADSPRPLLIRGILRHVHLDTTMGLYGNAFAIAPAADVIAACTPIKPPTVSNIIAMDAPPGGSGTYTRETLLDIWETALTAFYGAVSEASASSPNPDDGCTIHTGWWGTGAYGGNRTLMAIMQVIAARAAGVSRLVFHTVDDLGADDFETAMALPGLAGFTDSETIDPEAFLEFCDKQRFQWGISNGT